MADLIPKGGPRPTGTPPGMDPHAFDDVDENTVTPEEQEQYDQIASKALDVIWDERSQGAILEQMNQPDMEIHEAVGRAAAQLMGGVAASAKAAGVKISPDAVWAASRDEVVPALFELGKAAGIFDLEEGSQEEQDQINMAFYEGARIYLERMLQEPDAQRFSAEAQDVYAEQVAREVDAGDAPPDFRERLAGRGPVTDGVRRALHGA